LKTEHRQQLENILRWFLVGVFGYLYSQGGMEGGGGLWIRRYLAPFILAGGCYYLSRDWLYLVCAPLQMATLTIGYGADVLWAKILKRGIWGLLNGISFSLPVIVKAFYNSHLWSAFSFHMIISVTGSILLGVWNPLSSARAEEFTIGCLLAFIPVFCARRKVRPL
jgi:hypothetical protein